MCKQHKSQLIELQYFRGFFLQIATKLHIFAPWLYIQKQQGIALQIKIK
nr:MAG TPA: hypothetical protein [Caudoviricetes sp.]